MRLNIQVVVYGAPVVFLALGFTLVMGWFSFGPAVAQSGWTFAMLAIMLQSAYLAYLLYPFRQPPLKILRQQLPMVITILAQVPLVSFSISMLSPLETVALAMLFAFVSSWILYNKQLSKRRVKIFGELKEIINEFTKLNFKPANENEDFSIIRLLEKITLRRRQEEDEVEVDGSAATRITWIGNAYFVFHSWLSSITHKVDLVLRNAKNLQEKDLVGTFEEFIAFYNDYLNRIVETVVDIVNGSRLEDRRLARLRFDIFKEKMGQLRYRLNSLAKELRDDGHGIMTEPTGLNVELR